MEKRYFLQFLIYLGVIVLGFGGYWYIERSDPGISVQTDDSTNVISLDDASATENFASGTQAIDDPLNLPTSIAKNSNSSEKKLQKNTSNDFSAPSSSDNEVNTNDYSEQNTIDSSSENSVPVLQATSTSTLVSGVVVVPQVCSFSNVSMSVRSVILNEIAWMGTLPENGETSAKAGEREWIELKNISSGTIDLSGWQILDGSENLKITVATGTAGSSELPAGGFYLLVRDGGLLPGDIKGDAAYSGGLSNAGDELALFDSHCATQDFLNASSGWPGGNNTTKQTLERNADGIDWHTSAPAGGTPRAENSIPAPPPHNLLTVSMAGGGSGIVSSSPAGILCGSNCEASYASGTSVLFSASPGDKSLFKDWLGPCAGITSPTCSVIVSSSVAIVAEFSPMPPPADPSSEAQEALQTISSFSQASDSLANGSGSTSSGSSGSTGSLNHLVISEIQISGASSSNDFVKIVNPTAQSVDLNGWKLHKKSSTGIDYSLKTFPSGVLISPGAAFVWANSEAGFADSVGADVSSTETLSSDNSVALIDVNGTVVDAVAWGTGTDQYVEGSAYPTDPSMGQMLARKTSNGVPIDSNDNANDFYLTSSAMLSTP